MIAIIRRTRRPAARGLASSEARAVRLRPAFALTNCPASAQRQRFLGRQNKRRSRLREKFERAERSKSVFLDFQDKCVAEFSCSVLQHLLIRFSQNHESSPSSDAKGDSIRDVLAVLIYADVIVIVCHRTSCPQYINLSETFANNQTGK